MKQERCRSCDAPIVWALTVPTGVPIPVDWEPVPDGNVTLQHGPGFRARLLATVLTAEGARQSEALTYVAHFTTCRDADAWRRRQTPQLF